MPIVKYKLVFLGDQNVGKTSIITRFIYDSFQGTKIPTVGIDFLTKTLQFDQQTIRLQLWDTAGQQRFRSLIPGYIKDADCCLVVFDASSKQSFESVPRWIDFVRENRGQDALIYLVCNKIDVDKPEVEQAAAIKICSDLHLNFEEVSAKTGKNILQLFRKVTKSLSAQEEEEEQEEQVKKVELIADGQKNDIQGKRNCRC